MCEGLRFAAVESENVENALFKTEIFQTKFRTPKAPVFHGSNPLFNRNFYYVCYD